MWQRINFSLLPRFQTHIYYFTYSTCTLFVGYNWVHTTIFATILSSVTFPRNSEFLCKKEYCGSKQKCCSVVFQLHKNITTKFELYVKISVILWKTMPGRLKQVPQDSTEWDRTDTGYCTDGQSNTCDIDIDSCSEPSSDKL